MYSCHCKIVHKISFLVHKWQFFRRAGMREEGLRLPLAFQYLILMIWRAYDLNLVMISSLASQGQDFKLGGLQFHFIKWLKTGIPTLRTCHFKASEDIMTKFKSQALHTTRIKCWKASGNGKLPSLIPTFWKIAIYVLNMKFYVLFCTPLYVLYSKLFYHVSIIL